MDIFGRLKPYTKKTFNNGQAPSIDKEFLEGAEKTEELVGLQEPIYQLVKRINTLSETSFGHSLGIEIINAILDEIITEVDEKLIVKKAVDSENTINTTNIIYDYFINNAAVNPGGRHPDYAVGDYSVSIGAGSYASGQYSVAYGCASEARAVESTAYGYGSQAQGDYSVAIGRESRARASQSIAVGPNSNCNMVSGIAIGKSATCNHIEGQGNFPIAIGYQANADGSGVAIGGTTKAGGGGVAIGENAKANLICIAIGPNTEAKGQTICIGGDNESDGLLGIKIGYYGKVIGQYGIAIGSYSEVTAQNSVAIGYSAKATTANTIVLGNLNTTALRCNVQTILELSDERVKENIELANTSICLNDVLRLPVSRFKYKKFTGTHLDEHRTGFLAINVQKVFPKSVHEADEEFPLLDEEGNEQYENVELEDGSVEQKLKTFKMEKVKTIAMEMAIPTLWGAIQEQQNIINELKNRVDNLTQEIESFKNK